MLSRCVGVLVIVDIFGIFSVDEIGRQWGIFMVGRIGRESDIFSVCVGVLLSADSALWLGRFGVFSGVILGFVWFWFWGW